MTHSPAGFYSSALNHTNHEREMAGMGSKDLKKHVFVKNSGKVARCKESPDLFFCMNRVHADGARIENPYLDDGNHYVSAQQRAHLSVTGAYKRPKSAGPTSPSGGYNSRYKLREAPQAPPRSPDDDARSPHRNERQKMLNGQRQNRSRQEVPEWPRNWGRAQSSIHAFQKAEVGQPTHLFTSHGRAPPPSNFGSDRGSDRSGYSQQSARRLNTADRSGRRSR